MPFSIGRLLLQIGRNRQFYWSIEKSTNGIDGFWKICSKKLPMGNGISAFNFVTPKDLVTLFWQEYAGI